MPQADILCPTYNCALHIRALVESIAAQSYNDWRLIIRDDGSTDGTTELLKKIENESDDRTQVVSDDLGNLGPSHNFERLLSVSTAPYAMFCNHDDVWLQDKVTVTLEQMRVLETKRGEETPCLIHTDLKVTDDALNILANSLWERQDFDPRTGPKFERLALRNAISGRTVMINRALREMALPFPEGVLGHDWWVALVASHFGEIGSLAQPTVLHRQHARTSTDHRSSRYLQALRAISGLFDISALDDDIARVGGQAQGFLARFADDLPVERRRFLRDLALLPSRSWLHRRRVALKHGIENHRRPVRKPSPLQRF